MPRAELLSLGDAPVESSGDPPLAGGSLAAETPAQSSGGQGRAGYPAPGGKRHYIKANSTTALPPPSPAFFFPLYSPPRGFSLPAAGQQQQPGDSGEAPAGPGPVPAGR